MSRSQPAIVHRYRTVTIGRRLPLDTPWVPPYYGYMDITTILKAGTPVYVTDPGTTHTGVNARSRRHVATVVRPMRDYGRNTASYYEVRLWDGRERVYSADYIGPRHEGQDAHAWDATH